MNGAWTVDATPSRCTCSWHNAHLLDLDEWVADPNCPRHGLDAVDHYDHQTGDPSLDIDTSYRKEQP